MTDDFTPEEITEDTDEVDGVPLDDPAEDEDQGPIPMQAGVRVDDLHVEWTDDVAPEETA